VIQIVQQGRSAKEKTAMYAALAERLHSECGLAPTNLIVSVTANRREDWSFWNGEAQFLIGLL
jgi:hypothetical protein